MLNMKGLLRDFKRKKVFSLSLIRRLSRTKMFELFLLNFNQTIARHMFCQVSLPLGSIFHLSGCGVKITREMSTVLVYQFSRLSFINSLVDRTDRLYDAELIRAMNGTIQTRIPRLSIR